MPLHARSIAAAPLRGRRFRPVHPSLRHRRLDVYRAGIDGELHGASAAPEQHRAISQLAVSNMYAFNN